MIGNLCAVFLLSEKAGRDKCRVDGVNHAWCSISNPKGLFLFKLRVEKRSLKSELFLVISLEASEVEEARKETFGIHFRALRTLKKVVLKFPMGKIFRLLSPKQKIELHETFDHCYQKSDVEFAVFAMR